MFDVIEFTLAAAVADAGTVTVGYPTGRSKGNYVLTTGKHKLVLDGNVYSAPADFTLTFNANASSITLTNASGKTWAQGASAKLQAVHAVPDNNVMALSRSALDDLSVKPAELVVIDLGSPNTADADGVCASQALNTGVDGTINGALATGGVATFDVPRNVVAAWTNTAVITVTGTDVYGNAVVESSGSGTSLAGKKAFKTITKVRVSANVTGLTVGSGDVLGLPIALPKGGLILKELEDGAAATAGTVVAASLAEATATTGDVRGTYDPNSACNGDKGFVLIAAVTDPANLGVAQYYV